MTEQEQANPRREKWRRQLALALLLLFCGMTGGVLARKWISEADGPAAGLQAGGSSPFKPAGLSRDAATMWSRLVALLGVNGSRKLTFQQLAAMLLKHRGNAAALAFAGEFMRNEELRRIWERYQHAGDSADALWLAQRLSDSQSFTNLLNHYASYGDFKAVSEALARDMSSELVRGGAAGVKAYEGLAADFASAGPAGGRAAREYRSIAGENAGAGAAGAAPGYGAPNERSDAEFIGRGGSHAGGAGAEAHEIVRIGSARWDGMGRNTSAILASLFTKMDKRDRDRILPHLEEGYGIQGSCERAEATAACEQAVADCRRDPNCAKNLPPIVIRPPDPSYLGPPVSAPADPGITVGNLPPAPGADDPPDVSAPGEPKPQDPGASTPGVAGPGDPAPPPSPTPPSGGRTRPVRPGGGGGTGQGGNNGNGGNDGPTHGGDGGGPGHSGNGPPGTAGNPNCGDKCAVVPPGQQPPDGEEPVPGRPLIKPDNLDPRPGAGPHQGP